MGRSQVPRGTTKKEKCECGRFFYPYQLGNKVINKCEICIPRREKKE